MQPRLGRLLRYAVFVIGSYALINHARAEQINVAVASNFSNVATQLQTVFQAQSEHSLRLSVASTGKHYAQIKNGAPFDVFLAADAKRPELLELEGFAIANNRFTYALGQLVLWSASATVDERTLTKAEFRHLAIANPKVAPYGFAAQQTLRSLNLHERLNDKLVFAENIGQAFAFVYTGNAELGLVAESQVIDKAPKTKYWRVPSKYYQAIEQQAVLLSNKPAAAEFLLFLKDDKAKSIIASAGFTLP